MSVSHVPCAAKKPLTGAASLPVSIAANESMFKFVINNNISFSAEIIQNKYMGISV